MTVVVLTWHSHDRFPCRWSKVKGCRRRVKLTVIQMMTSPPDPVRLMTTQHSSANSNSSNFSTLSKIVATWWQSGYFNLIRLVMSVFKNKKNKTIEIFKKKKGERELRFFSSLLLLHSNRWQLFQLSRSVGYIIESNWKFVCFGHNLYSIRFPAPNWLVCNS